jgi:hypothetical protein
VAIIPLGAPPADIDQIPLGIQDVDPNRLIRISRHVNGEPFFRNSGAN